MYDIFLKVLNMSIAASWLILAVILLRLALKRIPKWIAVALWGIVALRLAVPFSFESALSLIPSAETFNPYNIRYGMPVISSGIPAVNHAVNPILSETFAPNPGGSVNPLYTWTTVVSVIWLVGVAAMLVYAVISYARVRRSVAERVPYEENIYLCDHVKSPFILGLISPKIYLPSGMERLAVESVIAHEKAHLARRDHWWKPMGFLILAIHWFNPLCWVAYALLCRDIELACDEKVIRQMDLDGKKQYSTALLECSAGRRLVTICPLAFGEVGVKERVKNVLNYKKPAFWVIVLAVIACTMVTVFFATNPVQNNFDLDIHVIADSEDLVFYTDEEVCSRSGVIELTAGQGLGDTMVQLLPAGAKEGNAYDKPQYITPGLPVKFQVEKGEWFRIGIGPLKVETSKDINISVKNVDVRIADRVESNKMTLSDVVMLSKKEGALTWSDFAQYQGQEVGSGLYIMRYEIDKLFDVMVGGSGNPNETPMYVRLRVNNEAEDNIDIRTEDVSAFIEAHRNDVPKTATPKPDGGGKPSPEEHDVSTISDEQAVIRRAILDHNRSADPTGFVSCASFADLTYILDLTNQYVILPGDSAHKTIHYGWALYEEYKVTDSGLETVGSKYTPVALSFDLDEKGYTLAEYWEPRGGSYYEQDIRERFPSSIAENAMDSSKFILRQKQECYDQAVECIGLDTDKAIGALIETICSSPAQSSLPGDYIAEHPVDYQALIYYGRYTLKYCFNRFEQGGEIGLDGHIMMRACGDITTGWGEEPLEFSLPINSTPTGQMWYSAFKSNALNLMEQYSEMELAERYPASYLLLTMLEKL